MEFQVAIKRILSHEGGFSKDPTDPGNWTGGEPGKGTLLGTKYGIAANTYPNIDIPNLTWERAAALYEKDFWEKVHPDVLPDLLDFQLLDAAVNSGIPQAIRFLQRALGVADDGMFGPHSRTVLVAAPDKNDLAFLFLAERLEFMTKRKNWPQHGKGWAMRIAQNMRYAAQDN